MYYICNTFWLDSNWIFSQSNLARLDLDFSDSINPKVPVKRFLIINDKKEIFEISVT